MSKNTSDRVQATETTLRVVEALQVLEGGRVNEIANHLDKPPSTVHRHLNTLLKHDYVTKKGDEYLLGMRFLTVGGVVQNRDPAYEMAKHTVEELAELTGERVQFLVEEHGYRIYVHTTTGEQAVRTDSRIGKRGLLHCSAAGKSILSQLPDPYVEEILDRHGLPQVTPHTITDRDELEAELEEIRQRGVAYNREESTEGLNAVGTVVKGPQGRLIGGLSVSSPAHRLKNERLSTEIPDLLLGAANELELNIRYQYP
jgi:DNA-binding IclR family transcriptional regulator